MEGKSLNDLDWELVQLARTGDKEAWDSLYKRHRGCLYLHAKRTSTKLRTDVDTCLSYSHETFVRVVKNYDPSKGTKFITYLWRSLGNKMLQVDPGGAIYVPHHAFGKNYRSGEIARRRQEKLLELGVKASRVATGCDWELFEQHSQCDSYESRLSDSENHQRLRDAASRLLLSIPKRHRKMIYLYYRKGMTLKDVGDRFGVTRECVRQTINKGKQKMQKRYTEDYEANEDRIKV